MALQEVSLSTVVFLICAVMFLAMHSSHSSPPQRDGVRVQVHGGLAARNQPETIETSGALLGGAGRAPATPLGQCTGNAHGSPNIKPSVHPPRKAVTTVVSSPDKFTPPKSRRCRDLNQPLPPPKAPEPLEGFESLVAFGKVNRLQPTCDISKLRSWGGFPIPTDYCTAGPGTHFGHGAGGEVSFTSYEMRPELQAKLKGRKLARLAWIPSIRKCGSTVVSEFFTHTKATTSRLAKDKMTHPDVWTDEMIARHFFQFTVVRDPLTHFLAGAHQVIVFHRMGWLGGIAKRWGVEFHNRTCLNTTWGKIPVCDPPYANAVEMLEVVLDDIERLGFFDEHVFPMTFPISVSQGMVNPTNYYLFDMSNITALENEMNKVVYDDSEDSARYKTTNRHFMSRDGPQQNPMPWVIKASELLALAEHDCKARSVVQRFCHLYAEDYACLPYELPRVCQNIH